MSGLAEQLNLQDRGEALPAAQLVGLVRRYELSIEEDE